MVIFVLCRDPVDCFGNRKKTNPVSWMCPVEYCAPGIEVMSLAVPCGLCEIWFNDTMAAQCVGVA